MDPEGEASGISRRKPWDELSRPCIKEAGEWLLS